MRVIGSIEHPVLKITVFETDGRYPIQFERGAHAQIYRIRKGGLINSLADIKSLVNQKMCKAVIYSLNEMHQVEQTAMLQLDQQVDNNSGDLPQII